MRGLSFSFATLARLLAVSGTAAGVAIACGADPAGPDVAASSPDASALTIARSDRALDIARNLTLRDSVVAPILAGRAPVGFRVVGETLRAASDDDGRTVMHVDVELPTEFRSPMMLRALGDGQRALTLTPVGASPSDAVVSDEGRVIYDRAFGDADLIATLDTHELHQTLVIRGAAAPDLYVWKADLGIEGKDTVLRRRTLDDGRTAFVDTSEHLRLLLDEARIVDATGAEYRVPVDFSDDGYASLRVEHTRMTYPVSAHVVVHAPSVGVMAGPPVPNQVKARLMVLLDTSGSMRENFAGSANLNCDGTAASVFCDNAIGTGFACNANVACTTANGALSQYACASNAPSKIYAAKQAITNVITAHNGVIDFGLSRFRESGGCPGNGSWCWTPQINGTTAGRGYGATTWSNTYDGGCGSNANGGRVLVSPSGTSNLPVLTWIDANEDFCSSTGAVNGQPRNPELRADNATPLARSIRYMGPNWIDPIKAATVGQTLYDPLLSCRPYVLVVMSDGDDTCGLDPSDEVHALRYTGAGTGNPKYLAGTNLLFVSTMGMGQAGGGIDQNELNAMMVEGGAGSTAPLAASQQQIEAAFADIVAKTVKFEQCNSIDDNCNALVDEGLGVYKECTVAADCSAGTTCDQGRCTCTTDAQCGAGYLCQAGTGTRFCRPSCAVGVGACLRSGIKKCSGACCANTAGDTCTAVTAGAPTTETCNGIDDNCNGIIDDTSSGCTQTCTTEVCDGVDNDCDGLIDTADPSLQGVGQPCGNNIGVCTPGTSACVGGSLVCQGGTQPGTETCNGLDDDCDGTVDGMTRACYSGPGGTSGVGPCRGGTQACVAVVGSGTPTWGTCVGEQVPVTETCNGIDDNCNGTVDDVTGVGQTCCPNGTCNAPCVAGVNQCVAGSLQCVGYVGPSVEVCNGVDDNCNGTIDDVTGTNQQCCPSGNCGVGICTAGNTQCVGTIVQCVGASGPATEVCDNVDNDCNGTVDDLPGKGGACCPAGVACGVGICTAGTLGCQAGNQTLVCTGAVGPSNEICNNLDDNCNGLKDDVPGAGATCCTSGKCGTGICQAGVQKCQGNALACTGEVLPTAETCNGLDDNCDGIVDNVIGLNSACCPFKNGAGQDLCGVGTCTAGTLQCQSGFSTPQCVGASGPSLEQCNGLDDNCNNIVDDLPGGTVGGPCYTAPPATLNVGVCREGTLGCGPTGIECVGQVTPSGELCNLLDDDCNGTVDDVPGLGTTCCPAGANCGVGVCRSGTLQCNGTSLTCAGATGASPEVCDGLDNDCNGVVDDVTLAGKSCCPGGAPDGTDAPGACNKGVCRPGVFRCQQDTGGAYSLACTGGVGKSDETCNGQDDDCDGTIDETADVTANDTRVGQDCDAPVPPQDHPPCAPGKTVCVGGGIQCGGGVKPGTEICNGVDDDCDGVSDNEAPCPPTFACIAGACRGSCGSPEFPCPNGYQPTTINGNCYCSPTGAGGTSGSGGSTSTGGTGGTGADGGVTGGTGGTGADGGVTGGTGGTSTGGTSTGGTSTGGTSTGGSAGSSAGGSAGSSSGGTSTGGTSTGGTSSGGASSGGSSANAGSGADNAQGNFGLASGGGGCACRAAGDTRNDTAALLLAGLAMGSFARRRRNRRAA